MLFSPKLSLIDTTMTSTIFKYSTEDKSSNNSSSSICNDSSGSTTFCSNHANSNSCINNEDEINNNNNSNVYEIVLKVQQYAQSQAQNIAHEFSLLKRLVHPHIISVGDFYENLPFLDSFGVTRSVQAFTMELANSDLHQHIELDKSPMHPNTARRIFGEIAQALLFMHQNKVSHNDIKLENILLLGNGTSKLADFGFASQSECVIDNQVWSQRNPQLLAPEIIQSVTQFSESCYTYSNADDGCAAAALLDLTKADVFAFGLTLFECMFRTLPFEFTSASSDSYYCHIANKDYASFWRIKPFAHYVNIYKKRFADDFRAEQFQDLMNKLIASNPEDRIPFDEIAAHPWLQFQIEESDTLSSLETEHTHDL